MAKHMGIDERKRIELLLGLRWTVSEIAHEMGHTESTISREVLARRVASNRGYGCTNRICEHFDTCRGTRSWGDLPAAYKRRPQKSPQGLPLFFADPLDDTTSAHLRVRRRF